MVLEALALGRHVIWTKKFPFVRQVVDFASIHQNVSELLALHETGALRFQQDAADFVRKRYDRERCVRDIAAAWAMATDGVRQPAPAASPMVDSKA